MNFQAIYLIEKSKNLLIFLDNLTESNSIDQNDMETMLNAIITKCASNNKIFFEYIEISGTCYTYGNFEKLVVIIQHQNDKAPTNELLEDLYNGFIEKFSILLSNYSEDDVIKFKGFAEDVKKIIAKKSTFKVKEAQVEVKQEKKIKIQPKKEEQKVEIITEDIIGLKPLVNSSKRTAYPEGIPEYSRDEVLFNESQMVKDDYVTEYAEGVIFNIKIFLSISLTHHYEIYIDFSNYPDKPKIVIGQGLQNELGKNIEELLYLYKNWDSKIPPHIVELVREIEAVLMKFKSFGKLSETTELPESALPDLEPLRELPPLEEKEPEVEKKPVEKPEASKNQTKDEKVSNSKDKK